MDCPHDREVRPLNAQAERLIAHLLTTGAAHTRWDALLAAVGFFQGLRAAMLSPEWAQAVIAEDDRSLTNAQMFHDIVGDIIAAVPVTTTTEPPESPA